MPQGAELPLAICLMGPTASGKTQLAIDLVQHMPVEIISVDSALIYRGMDIGTAKPTKDELSRAPHRLIDIVDPWESYSVARFYEDVQREMTQVCQRGNVPLLVGGTMMYFKVLKDGIAALPSGDEQVRLEIEAEAKLKGWPALHAQLASFDPVSAQRIAPNDPQRLQRAIEVYRVSGKTLTQFWADQEKQIDGSASLPPIPYKLMNFAIAPEERSRLHERIELRFDMMLEAGFLDEMAKLHADPRLEPSMPAMRCVGYRQAWEHLDGKMTYAEMREKGIIATRQLAKRQLTWLRGWDNLTWLPTAEEPSQCKKNLDRVLNSYNSATI